MKSISYGELGRPGHYDARPVSIYKQPDRSGCPLPDVEHALNPDKYTDITIEQENEKIYRTTNGIIYFGSIPQ